MFKRGSPFQIPTIQGGRKIQKQQPPKNQKIQLFQKSQYQNCKNSNSNQLQGSLSTFDQRFCFQLQVPSQTDQSLFWSYNLTPQVSGQYSRRLIFRQMCFVARSLAQSQIVQTVYIIADDVQGYKDISGVSTNRVCALHLQQSQLTLDDTDQKSYDVLYKQTQDVLWQIPMDKAQLKFRIYFDDQMKIGPLNVPLVCQFDIRHSGK